MFVSSEEPRYISAFIGMMAFGLSSSACAIVRRTVCPVIVPLPDRVSLGAYGMVIDITIPLQQ